MAGRSSPSIDATWIAAEDVSGMHMKLRHDR